MISAGGHSKGRLPGRQAGRTAAMGSLRVVAVDDHQLMLDAIRITLEDADAIELVGEALSGSEALPVIARTQPDIVLLDIRMPNMDGLACLGKIRERHPNIKVVILSGTDEPEQIRTALEQGACAFVVKHVDPRDLASALRQAAAGTVFQVLDSGDSSEETAARTAGITESELRVLRSLAQGMSNKQIAGKLFITEQTVKFHLTNIYRKLNVSNRTEATRYAYQHGLVVNPFFEVA
jgi:DNA-binding NarL/FixJ family response regulator